MPNLGSLAARLARVERRLDQLLAVPPGGLGGEVLTKISSASGDYAWAAPPAGGGDPTESVYDGGSPYSTHTQTIDAGRVGDAYVDLVDAGLVDAGGT